MVGDNALWKNAQKIAKKNNASETMNKPTPMLRPLCTAKVWLPRYVPSDITSLNHKLIEYVTLKSASIKVVILWKNVWKVKAAVNAVFNKDILVLKGQGLGETKWKGWDWNKLLSEKFIIACFLYTKL